MAHQLRETEATKLHGAEKFDEPINSFILPSLFTKNNLRIQQNLFLHLFENYNDIVRTDESSQNQCIHNERDAENSTRTSSKETCSILQRCFLGSCPMLFFSRRNMVQPNRHCFVSISGPPRSPPLFYYEWWTVVIWCTARSWDLLLRTTATTPILVSPLHRWSTQAIQK